MHTKDKRRPCRISIHALREEGDSSIAEVPQWMCQISIHALREEGDTFAGLTGRVLPDISIHALREEGDYAVSWAVINSD